ncbi:MAG: hypothetical protein HZR80_13565 [Candidatus Heimdallarchaeota archaeon]
MDKICILGLGYIGLPTALLFATNNNPIKIGYPKFINPIMLIINKE